MLLEKIRNRSCFRFRRAGGWVPVFVLLAVMGLAVGAEAQELRSDEKRLLEIYDNIRQYHLKDANTEKLLNGAIEGMMETLDDPHSRYFSSEEYKTYLQSLERTFAGVGMYVHQTEDGIVVQSPVDGTPAKEAGLQAGDRITKVNGEDVSSWGLEEVTSRIKGEPGTEVTLTVQREGEATTYTLVRKEIHLPVVESEMLTDSIGYIRLYSFSQSASDEFENHLKQLQNDGMENLIFDLRNNPGGYLDSAVAIADRFIGQGPIVHVVNSRGEQKAFGSDDTSLSLPTVLLMNQGSASASEVVAGALQDIDKAEVVGTKSFGKGTVQSTFPLESGGVMKLTIREYLTPNERHIHGIGIEPDMTVSGEEAQLDAAIRFLERKEVLQLRSSGDVYWQGELQTHSTPVAVQRNGQWFLSLRTLAERVDGHVSWDAKNKTVHLRVGESKKQYRVQNERLRVENGMSYLDVTQLKKHFSELVVDHIDDAWYVFRR